MVMSCSMQQVLADSRQLVERLREHDSNADILISHAQFLDLKVETMKRYQQEITQLNEVARHWPRSALVLGIQAENRHIRELQQENKELRLALDEHQSALTLIMSKYREQMLKLTAANKLECCVAQPDQTLEKLKEREGKIAELAAVMQQAAIIDDSALSTNTRLTEKLVAENINLRRMLEICYNKNSAGGATSLHEDPPKPATDSDCEGQATS